VIEFTDSNQTRYVSIENESNLACQIWSWSISDDGYRSPQNTKFGGNCGFSPYMGDSINCWWWHSARHNTPWVYSLVLNCWTWKGWVQEPPNLTTPRDPH